jgi:CDP-glucose 4,6-dehydratase
VFLTGHTGFKGGWMSLWLAEMGATVQGYALPPPTTPSFFDSLDLGHLISHQIGDIRDRAALRAAIHRFAPDIIIHMAAQPLVLASYENPAETFETNVMGTVNVLEAARDCDTAQVTLIVTTDKTYENDGSRRAYIETDRLGGHDPYSSSKACAELVTAAYAKSFFQGTAKAVATVRAGNVIGGGDWAPNRLMTDVITALTAGRSPVLRAPGAVRPWQHVLEPLAGYLIAIEHLFETPSAAAAWNFGPAHDDEATTQFVASLVCDYWVTNIQPVTAAHASSNHEAHYLALDSTKARHELGWAPAWNLQQAVQHTTSWYKAWQNHEDLRAFTLRQIADYIENPHEDNGKNG